MKSEIRKIEYSERFLKQLSKLPKRIIKLTKEKEVIFRENAFDSRLKTHKLHGKSKEVWAFWIARSYRIKFIFLNGDKILFLEIGIHDIYD